MHVYVYSYIHQANDAVTSFYILFNYRTVTIDPEKFATTSISVNKTDVVYLEHVVLTVTLTLEGYNKEYDQSDFYEAYSYYYPNSEKNDEILDFEFDEQANRDANYAETYSATLVQWLEAPHPRRGDIQVELTSPYGTTSVMLPYRRYDFVNDKGYAKWPFMSVHFWGEDPVGDWTVTVRYKSSSGYVNTIIHSLKLYGTLTVPESVAGIPLACDPLCSDGCAGAGTRTCDACATARDLSSLECVAFCRANDTLYEGYCIDAYHPSHPPSSCYYNVALVISLSLIAIAFLLATIVSFFVIAYWRRRRKETTLSSSKCDRRFSEQEHVTLME